MKYDTDGLRMRGNGNFKFQNAITGEYLEKHDPNLYQQVLDQRTPIRNVNYEHLLHGTIGLIIGWVHVHKSLGYG